MMINPKLRGSVQTYDTQLAVLLVNATCPFINLKENNNASPFIDMEGMQVNMHKKENQGIAKVSKIKQILAKSPPERGLQYVVILVPILNGRF